MKIISQAQQILPIFNRPKRVKKRTLPWSSYVPPDSVDVQLIPRRNLYGRSPLRFRSMGTESTMLRDALLIYQDEINPFPKDMPSQEELALKLEEIQEEFAAQRNLERYDAEPELPELGAEEVAGPESLPPQAVSVPPGPQITRARFTQVEPEEPIDVSEGEEDHARRFADWVQQVTVLE